MSGVDPATHAVATYIFIEGVNWWTKPTFAMPTVPIDPDGTFTVDVVTGGVDDQAVIYHVALVAAGYSPPLAAGSPTFPSGLASLATDRLRRYGRQVQFAGRTWGVKESGDPIGPGPNRFSSAASDVFVDAQGHLHLTIHQHDGTWWSTEVVLLDELGFGTYSFQTASRVDVLDARAVFAGFTWDSYGGEQNGADPYREIDFEDSRWAVPGDPTNAQMVVQPYSTAGNLERYTIPDLTGAPALTRFFTWAPAEIRFVALRGHHSALSFPPASVIHEFRYSKDSSLGHHVPTTGYATFRFNLWLHQGLPPSGAVEVVVTDFHFTPKIRRP